jgi:Firmicute plasmid replication protein (RepL)
MSKYKIIRYMSDIEKTEDVIDGQPVYIPVYEEKAVVITSTKRFHNCIYLLAGLPGCARDLMDYLAEIMDEKNIVRNDSTMREAFINFMKEITNNQVSYKDSTVNTNFNLLAERKLLIRKGKGVYMVNPEYFYKGDDKNRINSIKLLLEFKPDENTNLKISR